MATSKTITILGDGGITATCSGNTITLNASGVSVAGADTQMIYGVCTTVANVSEKTVNISGIKGTLQTGQRCIVKFTKTNSKVDGSMTLNVSSTGAATVWYNGAPVYAPGFRANAIYEFVYNGSQWCCMTPLIWEETDD